MFRLVLAFSALAVAAPVHAQAPDSALAAYAGLWEFTIADTPIGAVAGTLDVAANGAGTISMPAMAVERSLLTSARVSEGALVVGTAFSSEVSGQTHIGTITLAPVGDGTLAGVILDFGDEYPITARRADH